MTNEQTKELFLNILNTNAYIGLCECSGIINAISALEKQIPKKPLHSVNVGDTFYGLNETSYDEYEVYGFMFGKHKGEDKNVLIILTTYDMEFVWG